MFREFSSSTPLKNIVLVHGAFADGSCWQMVIPSLLAEGFNVAAVQLPLSSLADDVAAVARVIGNMPGPVMLVGHSWGGAVITEAGNNPKIVGLVYVAAGAPDSGESFGDWWKDYTPAPGAAHIQPFGSDGYFALSPQGFREDFVQDLPDDEKALLLATQGPLAGRCFSDKVTTAAWRSKPCWYVVAANDRLIPPDVERDSALRMNAVTITLASSHCPMLSHPKEVAEFILEAAQNVGAMAIASR